MAAPEMKGLKLIFNLPRIHLGRLQNDLQMMPNKLNGNVHRLALGIFFVQTAI